MCQTLSIKEMRRISMTLSFTRKPPHHAHTFSLLCSSSKRLIILSNKKMIWVRAGFQSKSQCTSISAHLLRNGHLKLTERKTYWSFSSILKYLGLPAQSFVSFQPSSSAPHSAHPNHLANILTERVMGRLRQAPLP